MLEGFLIARARRGLLATLGALSIREWGQVLKAVPWRRPYLALHVLRRAYRALFWACSVARHRPGRTAADGIPPARP